MLHNIYNIGILNANIVNSKITLARNLDRIKFEILLYSLSRKLPQPITVAGRPE